jgi:hypothetical protein
VYLASFVDSLTCQSFYNRGSNRILSRLLLGWQGGGSAAPNNEPGSGQLVVLVNLDVASFKGWHFWQLFEQLLSEDMICLALYRTASTGSATAPQIRCALSHRGGPVVVF